MGPSETIGSIYQWTWWAHSSSSAACLKLNPGPRSRPSAANLSYWVGPFKVVDSVSEQKYWAHLRLSAAALGPFKTIGNNLHDSWLDCGPNFIWAHWNLSTEPLSYDNWPIRSSRQCCTLLSLAPYDKFGSFIYGPIHDIHPLFTWWAHRGFPIYAYSYLVGPHGFHRGVSSICTWAFTDTSSMLCDIMWRDLDFHSRSFSTLSESSARATRSPILNILARPVAVPISLSVIGSVA